jgi:hypothetical protein
MDRFAHNNLQLINKQTVSCWLQAAGRQVASLRIAGFIGCGSLGAGLEPHYTTQKQKRSANLQQKRSSNLQPANY